MSQSPIKIKSGNPLDTGEATSNVATNKAELEALRSNIDGTDSYPRSVTADHMSASNAIIHGAFKSGSMMVGSGGVAISSVADGAEPTGAAGIFMGIADGKAQFYLNDTDGNPTAVFDGSTGNVSITGTVTATDGAFPGSLITGNISVGAGGVTIGDVSAGISISGNVIRCIKTGTTTIQINGDDGVVTCNRFAFTADGASSLDMSLGSLTIGATASINGTAASTVVSNAAAGAGKATTFAQTGVPTALAAGDLWCDTDDGNKLYRAAAAGANEIKAGEWVAVQDTAYTSKNVTFAQDGIPTALSAGDMWIDTNDSNKLYRAAAAGANEIKAGEWILYRDAGATAGASAIQPGGGVTVDGSKYITTINMSSGLVIKTSTSNAHTQMTADGMATYNSGNKLVVQIDHTNGVTINNASEASNPGALERLNFTYAGEEVSWIAATSDVRTSMAFGVLSVLANSGMTLQTTGDDIQISSGNLKVNTRITLEGGSVDPQILAGSPATYSISEGASASSYALGTLFLGNGGSIWTVYYDSGDGRNEWTRIYTGNYHPA